MRPSDVERTHFETLPDPHLRVILHRGEPATVRAVADTWGGLSVSLETAAGSMASDYRRVAATWTGDAAEQYATAVGKLVTAARRVAQMAAMVRDIMHDSADSLELAQRMFPRASDRQEQA